jgi:hypothetical protein
VLVAAVIGLAALLLVGGLVSIWADDLLLSPDNWESTSAQLLANPTVRASAATYLVDALDARVAALIAAGPAVELPPAARLATPAARATAVRDVERALTRPTAPRSHHWSRSSIAARAPWDRPGARSPSISIRFCAVSRTGWDCRSG